MPLNLDAVGTKTEPVERSWTSTDALLYAVAVGAGEPDPTEDLELTTENSAGVTQRVLPTFCTLLGAGGALRGLGEFNPAMLVHAEQGIAVPGPLPVEGRVSVTARLVDILDKRSGALVVTETEGRDPSTGDVRFTARSSVFIRGEGGFGGASTPTPRDDGPPDRAPDASVELATRAGQALLYRLCGDRNPLHSDPSFAARAGFTRPILHGLCTYGIAGRALLRALCDGDPTRLRAMQGRFTSPVQPGQTLTTEVWRDEATTGRAWFRVRSDAGGVVLDRGTCEVVD